MWALIENDLSLIYSYLLGTTLPQPPDRFHPPLHPLGLQVFEALHALNNRIDLLNRLAKWQATTKERERIEDLIIQLRKASNLRNGIVHGMWGICDDYPDDLILHPSFEEAGPRRYREHDFDQVQGKLRALHEALFAFILSMHRERSRKGDLEARQLSANPTPEPSHRSN